MNEIDFDFRHHLYDTVVLLGMNPLMAKMLKRSLDGAITVEDVEMLKAYNVDLINGIKSRLSNINTMKIRTAQEGES